MDAPDLAKLLLEGVGTRIAHTEGVVEQATLAMRVLDDPWRSGLVDAAWLHDIGYSPALVGSGFHPLDGARWLQSNGWSDVVCSLVAWHSRPEKEAEARGLLDHIEAEFNPPPELVRAALAFSDITTLPNGKRCTPQDRAAEVAQRYAPDSLVSRCMKENLPDLVADVELIEGLLAADSVL